MDPVSLKKTLQTRRLVLPFWDMADHYYVAIFSLFLVLLQVFYLLQRHLLGSYDGLRSSIEILQALALFVGVSVFIILIQRRKLKLKFFKINATSDQVKNALKKTASELEWGVQESTETFARATRRWELSGFGGEMITILPASGGILINSISDPNIRVPSLGFMHRANVRTFTINLYNEVNGTKILKPEERENKWSLGNTLFRIVSYPFCIGLILLSAIVFIPSGQVGLGVSAILISLYYFYSDLVS